MTHVEQDTARRPQGWRDAIAPAGSLGGRLPRLASSAGGSA
ncbi:hypothetical protein [Micromonospora sp. URMC 103]